MKMNKRYLIYTAIGAALVSIAAAPTFTSIILSGSSTGTLTLKAPAAAGSSSILTFPGHTTDLSATGGTSQVVKQTATGAALTVARLTCSDLSDSGAGCTGSGGGTPANPTASVGPTAVNGSATTYMRSDAAPAMANTTVAPGVYTNLNATVDQQGRITSAANGAGGTPANPSATVGPSAVNGSATTYMRSDAAPGLANTAVTAGAYTNLNATVDAQGRITAAANGSASGSPANPTATAGPVAVNGSAGTFMRSDGAPAIQKASNAQFGLVEGDGQTITVAAGIASATAPNRTVTSCGSCTLLTGDMGGQVNFNGSSLTVVFPSISSTVLAAGMTVTVVNLNASTLTISSTPTINGFSGTTLAQNAGINCTSNGTSLDCIALGAGGSGTPANPTATAGPAAINGSASTYMRSDGAPAVQKASNAQFGLAEGDGQSITCVVGVCSGTAPTRTATTPTVATTDMGGTIWVTGTITIPAITTGLFDAKQSLMLVNVSGSTETVTSAPTINAGGNCIQGTGIPAGYAWQIQSNNTTLDCVQVASTSSGGSPVTVTDGTHSVASTTTLTFPGTAFLVSGSAGSATATPIYTDTTHSGSFTLGIGAQDTLTASGTVTIPTLTTGQAVVLITGAGATATLTKPGGVTLVGVLSQTTLGPLSSLSCAYNSGTVYDCSATSQIVTDEICSTWDSTTAVTAQTIDFPITWASYTISKVKTKVSGGGSFSVAVKIGGTNVTSCSAISVSGSTNTNTSCTAANTGVVDDIISVVVSSPSGTVNQAYVCPVFLHAVN